MTLVTVTLESIEAMHNHPLISRAKGDARFNRAVMLAAYNKADVKPTGGLLQRSHMAKATSEKTLEKFDSETFREVHGSLTSQKNTREKIVNLSDLKRYRIYPLVNPDTCKKMVSTVTLPYSEYERTNFFDSHYLLDVKPVSYSGIRYEAIFDEIPATTVRYSLSFGYDETIFDTMAEAKAVAAKSIEFGDFPDQGISIKMVMCDDAGHYAGAQVAMRKIENPEMTVDVLSIAPESRNHHIGYAVYVPKAKVIPLKDEGISWDLG